MNEDDLLNLLVQSSMNTGQYASSQPVPGGFVNYNYVPDYLQQEADKHALAMAQIGAMGGSSAGLPSMGRLSGGGGSNLGGIAALASGGGGSANADAAAQRALELQIAQLQNATNQQRNAQDYQLGQGNLSLGQSRLALDDLLGKRSQQLQGAEQFATRATRQLAAPGGKLNPTLAPIMGISSIAGPTPY